MHLVHVPCDGRHTVKEPLSHTHVNRGDTHTDEECYIAAVIDNMPASPQRTDSIRAATAIEETLQMVIRSIRSAWPKHVTDPAGASRPPHAYLIKTQQGATLSRGASTTTTTTAPSCCLHHHHHHPMLPPPPPLPPHRHAASTTTTTTTPSCCLHHLQHSSRLPPHLHAAFTTTRHRSSSSSSSGRQQGVRGLRLDPGGAAEARSHMRLKASHSSLALSAIRRRRGCPPWSRHAPRWLAHTAWWRSGRGIQRVPRRSSAVCWPSVQAPRVFQRERCVQPTWLDYTLRLGRPIQFIHHPDPFWGWWRQGGKGPVAIGALAKEVARPLEKGAMSIVRHPPRPPSPEAHQWFYSRYFPVPKTSGEMISLGRGPLAGHTGWLIRWAFGSSSVFNIHHPPDLLGSWWFCFWEADFAGKGVVLQQLSAQSTLPDLVVRWAVCQVS